MAFKMTLPPGRGADGGSLRPDDPRLGRWDWDLALQSPLLAGLHALWLERCRDGALPGRGDFDPVAMKDYLGHIFLLANEPQGDDFRYTLIGTAITAQVHVDNTRRTVGEVFGEAGLRVYRAVRDAGRPVRLHGLVYWREQDHKAYETLILPLADDGRTITRFIGGMVFSPAESMSPPSRGGPGGDG